MLDIIIKEEIKIKCRLVLHNISTKNDPREQPSRIIAENVLREKQQQQ